MDFMERMAFESRLKAGDRVRVRWTNCRNRYATDGQIVKVNASSFFVVLTEPVGHAFLKGAGVRVPRCTANGFSVNNCVDRISTDALRKFTCAASTRTSRRTTSTSSRSAWPYPSPAPSLF